MDIDVDQLMQGELGQWLESQNAMRAEAKQKGYWRWTIGAAILLPVLAFVWFVPWPLGDFRMVISAFGAIGVAGWGYLPINTAKNTIKVGINSAIARSMGIEYAHQVSPGPEFSAAKTYGLLPSYDRRNCEDRWFGTLQGHRFSLYEAHLEKRRGSGKNRRWVTVFRGALIDMEFGRRFHSTTLLQRAGKHDSWFGLGDAKETVSFGGHKLDFVDQVHPDFADMFDVYSDDQVEARYIVHPSYIEHLMALEKAFEGENVRALFNKGDVIIIVKSKKLFESGSLNPAGDYAQVKKAAEQFSAMARLALAINQTQDGSAQSPSVAGAAD